jgi:diguanylate cyclase (GGDEF)-like protein/PAS domain S-box-containing protein
MNRKVLYSTSTRSRDVEIADDSIRGTDPVGSPTPLSGSPQAAPPVDPAVPTQREIQYRQLLERIPAVTYIAGFGESGAWTYVSPHIKTMLGFGAEEWVADPNLWFRQIHPMDRARAIEEENASKESGEPLLSEYLMLTRDGREIAVRDEALLVRGDDGRPLYWQGFLIDITDRRATEDALHESEVRYRSLFDHIPMGIYRTTPDGEMLDGNRTLWQMLGFPHREAMLAVNTADLYIDPSDRERWKAALDSEGSVRDFETQLKRQDGGVLWVRDSARAIRDREERIVLYEGVLQDVNRQKQTEWEARQANQQLSQWVGELERRNREISLINEMGDMLQGCPTADEAYAVIAHWNEQLFAGSAGAVCVINSSRNSVERVAVWGNPAMGEPMFAPDECWALRSGRVHVVVDPRSRLVCRHLTDPLAGGSLCVPMMAQGEALGILHLQTGLGGLSLVAASEAAPADSLRQLAVTVAEHLALALANLRLRETLRTQSIRDPLTGLFNRRYMEESLERELRRADRRGHPVSVIMLDLDHFNRFNNTFGHQSGDALLQAFGEMVRAQVRSEDIACRYGGEEFTLIMPEASMEVALRRAERLRQEVKELRIQQRGQSLGVVTVSLGVAVYPEFGATAEALIRAADLALYRAKAGGRDRVEVADQSGLSELPASFPVPAAR